MVCTRSGEELSEMHRFFVSDINEADKEVTITGQDVNHIANVLRLSVGDEITVSDGSSRDYLCSITAIDTKNDKNVIAEIIDVFDSNAELPADIYLFQGFPKGDKFETIIQKCVELGVHEIIPVMMDRTVVQLDDKKRVKKISRYQGIAEAAAKQSRRGIIPDIKSFMSFKEAVKYSRDISDIILVPYESAEGMPYSREVIRGIVNSVHEKENSPVSDDNNRKYSVAVFIGPEGGFANSEIELLKDSDAKIISLGHRILRTETAGMNIISVLGFNLDT